jgi:alpha-L-fucosidase 2
MKKCYFLCLLLFTLHLASAQNKQSGIAAHARTGISHSYPLSFKDWANAYLSGNGKMGIMVFGNPLNETIIFNDRNFNLAKSNDRSFAKVSPAVLKQIRDYCAAGNFEAANKLAVESSAYKGGGEGNRHPGFKMQISIPENGEVKNYSRSCDFRTGEIIVKWTDNKGDWERRSFVSRHDNVVVQYLPAPSNGKISCAIQLAVDSGMNFPKNMDFSNTVSGNYLNFRAKYPPDTKGAGYEGVIKVLTSGGTKTIKGTVMYIEGANSVTMISRTAKYYGDCENERSKQLLRQQLDKVPVSYSTLIKGQVRTHQQIYDRVSLDLNADAADRLKTNDELLAKQKRSALPVHALWERAFDAGRYYYLSSSSELSPPDLLGIWTGDCNAGWGGYYHLDANLNLQVGGGNIGDMPEAMEGYFKLNEDWRKDFQTNARDLLGTRGMVAAGNTPGASSGLMANINTFYPYHYATGEEPWLLYPFWEHYLVTGDRTFLRERLYPLLKDMGEFYEDFLTHKDGNGKYIFAGSVSPENQPSNLKVSLLNNSNFDISGAKLALTTLLQTCKTLGLEQGKGKAAEKWQNILDNLPPYLINADGALQEWSWPGLKDSYGHRHSSQLLMVWPYQEISPVHDPKLYHAARMTLAKKDEHSYENAGHGLLHAALIAAGLRNAGSVDAKLNRFFKEDFYFNNLCTSHYNGHGVFCTDVSHTVPTIMMEMLVASEPGVIELLPAIPAHLRKGEISGVKGRNRVTIQNLKWDLDAGTVECLLKSDIDQDITLIQRKAAVVSRVLHLAKGVSTPLNIKLKP